MGSESEAGASTVEVKLKRDLGLLEVTMIGLGPTLGSTIFLLVGFGLDIAGSGLVLVFILNFIVTIFTAMAYAELSSAFPDTGGGYLWVKEGLPQPVGFLAGWMSWFGHCIVTSFYVFGFGKGIFWILASQGVAFDQAQADFLVTVLAVAVCVVFIMINYRGTKETGRSGIVITLILLTIIIMFIVAGFIYISKGLGAGDVGTIVSDPIPNGWTSILIAMGFTFIVFEGYEIISQCGEECKDPLKNVPKASWLCIIISTIIFVLVAIVAIGMLDLTAIGEGGTIAGDDAVAEAAGLALPSFGVILIGMGVILGTLAAINSTLFSSSRVSFAMGRDGALPKSFGKLHKKRHTPHVAIFTSGAIVISMTVLLPIEQIAASADIMFLLLFFFVNLAAISLRYRRPDIKRHYLMPFFPYVPMIGIGTKFVLAVGLWWEFPVAWLIALAWILAGLVTYYFYGGKKTIETIEEKPERKGFMEAMMEKKEEKNYKILVPVAREDQKALVEFAALVARVEDAELQVSTVIELPSQVPLDSLDYKETAPHIKLVEKLKKASNRELVKAEGSILISHTASGSILDTVKEENINLLVLGWKGRTTEGRLFGVNLDALIQNADCDVVVFKTIGLKKQIKKILVVSTPEWHASYATSYAILFAKRDEAEITIFSASPTEGAMAKEEEYANRLVEICQTHGISHQKKIVQADSIEQAILSESENYDLVVMGAGEEWHEKKFAFGHLQDRVARAIKTPILMVRKVKK